MELGRLLGPGDVVALTGELGAGKTLLTKGIARGMGCGGDEVRSPSFVIVNIYSGRYPLYHIDFYRLQRTADLRDLGLEEFLYGDGVCVIEWADKFSGILPRDHICGHLRITGKAGREIVLRGQGKRQKELIERYAHRPEIRRDVRR